MNENRISKQVYEVRVQEKNIIRGPKILWEEQVRQVAEKEKQSDAIQGT